MAVISAANLNLVLDNSVLYSLKMQGTAGSGYGVGSGGTFGCSLALAQMTTAVLAFGDLDPIQSLAQPLITASALCSGLSKAAADLYPILSALQSHVVRFQITGVRTLDDYLTSLNTGGVTKWQALQAPGWKDLAGAWVSGYTTPAWNLYYEVLQGATFANGLGKWVVTGAGTGTLTSVATPFDGTLYAGGFPQVRVSSFGGSSGTVTVTGTAYDPVAKASVTGKTWTATVAGNGVVALVPGGATPAPTNSLIQLVTAIAASAPITAGTIYVEGTRPSGRPLLS
jgi:hypothetical protein